MKKELFQLKIKKVVFLEEFELAKEKMVEILQKVVDLLLDFR